MLIGVLPEARLVTRTVSLRPGDTLVLYSDGLTEARTDASEGRYGIEALHAFVTRLAPTTATVAITATAAITAIAELLATFESGIGDDVAVMALTVSEPPPTRPS
jgi:sigma-B regulation protein RsbU (phosphoserine phosphatase)